ncbi:MAG: amino acid ABC transporter substrate-binding protein [Acholeplasmataceae bacterium]|jgi:polar amino acid transport system substrate-binding protein|nr:amino acid ABC transporter substrate-binding protein [Candidatus Izemoplasmatales bacterium]
MKKIIVLLVAFALSFGLISCSSTKDLTTWEKIQEQGYFVVGLDDTFAPMGFRDDAGNVVGFDVDLAKEVAKRLGVNVIFQPIDWDSKAFELNSGTIDMIWNGLTITDSRLLEMSFSNPYLANRQIVITNNDSTIDTISDLSGLKVGVQISSASEEAVNANDIVSSIGELVKYDTYTQALFDLKNGTIDAVVIDEIMGRYMLTQIEDTYKIATEDFGTEEYGIGFRLEDTELRDLFNQTLQAMVDDGTAAQISMTWFGENIFLN